ncbi:hypothetical protein [Microbacterium aurantiacum]|uniref:hypothetical protein n=1 Tax=Microbacterium aurantiacum TaxID=162393 RepID=UPI000C7F8284|nr:hypothetical protein [Microbacterium aurantiacum]
MILKRTIAAAATFTVAALLMTACAPAAVETPKPTQTTAAPETMAPVAPPESEEEAVAAAEEVLTKWFEVRGEVNAAGGTDTEQLEALSTGTALERVLADAEQIANGPLLNVDEVNIDGPIKTEGAITYESKSAYGQEWEGVENGLVTINACQDGTDYKLFASDGSEGMRPAELRTTFDYQVIYDASREAWLVYDLISLGETC